MSTRKDTPIIRVNSFKTRRTTMRLLVSVVSLMLAAPLTAFALARDSKQVHSGRDSGQEMKAPQTAQEHRERAEHYQKKAAEYRQDAEAHKKMLADYTKQVGGAPSNLKDAHTRKMRVHCERYIKAAEDLAREAEEMAKYHLMRAKEMEGK